MMKNLSVFPLKGIESAAHIFLPQSGKALHRQTKWQIRRTSMHPYFENPYQLRIFMNISPEDQIANIIRRNGQEKAKEFQALWIPKEEAYFEKRSYRDYVEFEN